MHGLIAIQVSRLEELSNRKYIVLKLQIMKTATIAIYLNKRTLKIWAWDQERLPNKTQWSTIWEIFIWIIHLIIMVQKLRRSHLDHSVLTQKCITSLILEAMEIIRLWNEEVVNRRGNSSRLKCRLFLLRIWQLITRDLVARAFKVCNSMVSPPNSNVEDPTHSLITWVECQCKW